MPGFYGVTAPLASDCGQGCFVQSLKQYGKKETANTNILSLCIKILLTTFAIAKHAIDPHYRPVFHYA
jgi:hypothetical protein